MDHEFTVRCDIWPKHHFNQIDSIFLCLIVDSLMPPKHKQSSQTATNSQFTVEDDAVVSQVKHQRAVQPFDSEPSPLAGEFHENSTRLLHDTLTSFCNRYRTWWDKQGTLHVQGKVMAGSSSSSRILSVFKPQNIHPCQGATLTWLCRVKKSTPWLLITVATMMSLAKFHHGHHSQHYHHLCKAPIFNQHSRSLRLVNRLVSDFLLRLPLQLAVPSPLDLKVLPFHLPTAHQFFRPLCHMEVLWHQSCAPHPNVGPTMAMEQLIWMASPQDSHHTSICLQLLQTIPQMLLHRILVSASPLISLLHHSLKFCILLMMITPILLPHTLWDCVGPRHLLNSPPPYPNLIPCSLLIMME